MDSKYSNIHLFYLWRRELENEKCYSGSIVGMDLQAVVDFQMAGLSVP